MKVVISSSIKGGVGKTTVAAQTAKALQRRGLQVGVLDLDYRAPCIPIAMDAEDGALTHGAGDVLVPPVFDGIAIVSMAYIWPPTKCVMVEDNEATEQVLELLTPGIIAWPEGQQYLVVDTPPTSSGIVRVALEASANGDTGAILVTHPSRVSRADTLRTFDLFREKEVPVYALVSNQGTDEEGRRRYDLIDEEMRFLAAQEGIPIFQAIPHLLISHALGPHFDRLVEAVLGTKPVLLAKIEREVGGKSWDKLAQLSAKLLAKKS